MNAEIPAKYARLTAPEAAALIAITREALEESDSPAMREHLAHLQAVLNLRGVSTESTPAEQAGDDVVVGRRAGSATSNQYGTFEVYAATEKQVRFLQRLIDTKDTAGVKLPSTLEGISKTSASTLIEKLIDRKEKAGAAPAASVRLASEKQVAFIKRLLGEKDLTGTAFSAWTDELLAQLQMREASPAIDALMALPRKPIERKAEVVLAAGAYQVGEKIIRVYLGQQSGKMLAAELVDVTAENRDDAWNYLGMATRFVIADAHRLTVEECEAIAGASGQSFSWCCVCGRRLDDPNSVSRGIGPVCRAKQGA